MTGGNGEWRPPRRLRVFAFDPSTSKVFANRNLREVSIVLPAEMDETVGLGPSGEYFEVVDYDPASGCFYRPVDLDDTRILSNGGLPPSEENPQFHQQMVYAVAMNTVATFEEALGRPVLWAADERRGDDGRWRDTYIPRLRIYPHALREANAFYSPTRKSLLFGYFEAGTTSQSALPGTTVFTCLSHDIVVHETVHAILDGLHPRFAEASHPDMRALHEAFADIVAIFQLFSFPEVLEDQIGRTRGDLESQSMLGELAQEFGKALGRSDSLRSALGRINPDTHKWEPRDPDRNALARARGPHARGSVLVAAVFRAFLNIYKGNAEDLFRIASGGSGILRDGELDPDLTKRLSREAARIARRVLRICIRAMDYVAPVQVTFGDYLRAIMTADHDLYPADESGYRIAILEAFSAWGITPEGMPVVTQNTLLWPTMTEAMATDPQKKQGRGAKKEMSVERSLAELGALLAQPSQLLELFRKMGRYDEDSGSHFSGMLEGSSYRITNIVNQRLQDIYGRHEEDVTEEKINANTFTTEELLRLNLWDINQFQDREIEYNVRRYYALMIWMMLTSERYPKLTEALGLTFADDAPMTIPRSRITQRPSLHVLPVRRARRIGQRGAIEDEYVIELEQTRHGFFREEDQRRWDTGDIPSTRADADFLYRAGCTLLVDARTFDVRRLIRSPHTVTSEAGLARLRHYLMQAVPGPDNAFDDGRPGDTRAAFADLHRHTHANEEDW